MAKILITDDNATNRKVLATVLEHEGHETIETHDGGEAVRRAGILLQLEPVRRVIHDAVQSNTGAVK